MRTSAAPVHVQLRCASIGWPCRCSATPGDPWACIQGCVHHALLCGGTTDDLTSQVKGPDQAVIIFPRGGWRGVRPPTLPAPGARTPGAPIVLSGEGAVEQNTCVVILDGVHVPNVRTNPSALSQQPRQVIHIYQSSKQVVNWSYQHDFRKHTEVPPYYVNIPPYVCFILRKQARVCIPPTYG